MNNADRFLLFSPTSIRLPRELYNLIDSDAWMFGYRKNNKSNINGFLNDLLPSLASYMQASSELMSDMSFIDENTSKKIVSNTLSFDAMQLSLIKNTGVNVSFRVNKTRLNDFIDIFDNHLRDFDVNFSTFVRTVLLDYVSKRLFMRERLLLFKQFTELSTAISYKHNCFIVLPKQTSYVLPTHLIVSPYSDHNILFGLDIKSKMPQRILLKNVIAVRRNCESTNLDADINVVENTINKFLQQEKTKI